MSILKKHDRIKIIDTTIELLDKGWVQGSMDYWQNDHVSYCITGGLVKACRLNGFTNLTDEIVVASDVFRTIYPYNNHSCLSGLMIWNDAKHRIKEDVIYMLQRTKHNLLNQVSKYPPDLIEKLNCRSVNEAAMRHNLFKSTLDLDVPSHNYSSDCKACVVYKDVLSYVC